jgi:colanic acid biosynthesis protein WcaH
MELRKIIDLLEARINDPALGLPEEVFLFMSRIVPMINVDLLIKNKKGNILLTWREDEYGPAGWHVPGGIVRYRETFADRIKAVAATELGSPVSFNPVPLLLQETIIPSLKNRAHSISLLYQCTLTDLPDKNLRCGKGRPQRGQWRWHRTGPDDLIPVHEMYRKFM